MKFLKRFFDGIQRDLRIFLFILVLLEIYRAVFIFTMFDYMDPNTDNAQIFSALWTGLRLSLKTAGAVTLFPFVFCSIAGLTPRLRLAIGIFASLIFSTLFMARYPYYKEFHSTYGMEVLQGLNDDIVSIIVTIFQEYGMFWRFPVALILTVMCIAVLSRLLMIKTFPLPELPTLKKKILFTAGLVAGIVLFGIFARFGGSLNYTYGVNWENAALTSDEFLNECILDDGQALYRVRTMAKLMQAGEISGVDKENIAVCAEFISQRKFLNADNLAMYLERTAQGHKINTPRHIFIIMGENFMQWPMLGKYEDLHLADGIKSLIAEPNCYYSRNFMPNGDFTSVALTGMVTGIPDVNIRVNYQERTYQQIYTCAMAPPLKELGYKVDFWYGGAPSWDNIAKMSLAQGFDNFYGFSELNAPKQTTWGAKDEYLFKAIKEHLDGEPPTVHLIMTTTNHPPYNLDLKAEGFDFDATLAEVQKLPNIDDAKTLTKELGHYWYMDKVVTKFVREVSANYPDSVFVITGDHAVRTDPGTHPTIFEHQSVPFVLYGAGITQNILPPDAPGDHISIVPTIIELIAPQGFIYYSIAPPLSQSNGVGFNRDAFVTQNVAGRIDADIVELLPHVASSDLLNNVNLADERNAAKTVVTAMRTVGWWILTNDLKFR